jgi:hypothetical protein
MAGAEGQSRLDLDGDVAGGARWRSCEPCTKKRPARTGFRPSSERATQSTSGSTSCPDRFRLAVLAPGSAKRALRVVLSPST